MTWYPEAAATPESDGPNFESPTIGRAFQLGQRRLREAAAFNTVQREARAFHQRMALKHGVESSVGLAHFRAANSYREAAGKLQEMFDQQSSQLPPKALHKAHRAAAKFHKKAAEKAGIDSPVGQAHMAAMQDHMKTANNAKQQMKQQASVAGASGKKSPVPVPPKAAQPSEDIRQNLPPQPLKRLQQKQEAIDHFGKKKEAGDRRGPKDGMDCSLPKKPNRRNLQDQTDMFRAKRPKPTDPGRKAAAGRIHDAANERKDKGVGRESRRSLRRGF